MAELIGGEGEVAIVGHSQINSTGVERRDGFVDQMEAEYPDIEIVDIQYGDGDHLKSADIAKTMIQAHPDLKGIYGTNEGSAIGVVNAVGELGLKPGELTVVGFDSGQAQIDAITNGTMAGAITQNPIGIGEEVVQAAYDIIQGETPGEGHRHRLLLVRQDQHGRRRDRCRPLQVIPLHRSARPLPRSLRGRGCAVPGRTP